MLENLPVNGVTTITHLGVNTIENHIQLGHTKCKQFSGNFHPSPGGANTIWMTTITVGYKPS
jgi:hypothetical protein